MYVESLADFGRGSFWLAFWIPWKAKVIQLLPAFPPDCLPHLPKSRWCSGLCWRSLQSTYHSAKAMQNIPPCPTPPQHSASSSSRQRVGSHTSTRMLHGNQLGSAWPIQIECSQGHAVLSTSLTDLLSWQWKSMLFLNMQWFPCKRLLKCNYSADKPAQALLPVVDWCRCCSVTISQAIVCGCNTEGTSRPLEIPRSQ